VTIRIDALNNLDQALTREPSPDPWADDHEEATEDTGKKHKLTWGPGADAAFAAAHAAGAALRKLRRPRAAVVPSREEVRKGTPRVGHCAECGHQVSGWHRCSGWRSGAVTALTDTDHNAYYDHLKVILQNVKGRRKQRRDIPDMWRAPPGYGNYIMHSRTREVWRQAYDRTLPNGGIRHYPARQCHLRNGAYSLTFDGVTSSRGVNALWNETFPEFMNPRGTKKKVGEWAGEIEFRRNELGDYCGLVEWLGDGGARIVTRP